MSVHLALEKAVKAHPYDQVGRTLEQAMQGWVDCPGLGTISDATLAGLLLAYAIEGYND